MVVGLVGLPVEDQAQRVIGVTDLTFLNTPEQYRHLVGETGIAAPEQRNRAFQAFLKAAVDNNPWTPYALCVRTGDLVEAAHRLDARGLDSKLAFVAGFPDPEWEGSARTISDIRYAMSLGIDTARLTEVDTVIPYNQLKRGDYDGVARHLSEVGRAVRDAGLYWKLILETSELAPGEIAAAIGYARDHGVDMIKTSTGYASGGADAEKLQLMRDEWDGPIKISGGVGFGNAPALVAIVVGKDVAVLDPAKVRIGASSILAQYIQQVYGGEAPPPKGLY